MMFRTSPLVGRLALGKSVGLLFGLIAFLALPWFFAASPTTLWPLQWGLLLAYVTLGALLGLTGFMNRHPMLDFAMPWWFRGPLIGGFFFLMVGLLAYEPLKQLDVIAPFAGLYKWFGNPLYIAVDGILAGLVIDWIVTRVFGDGEETLSTTTA